MPVTRGTIREDFVVISPDKRASLERFDDAMYERLDADYHGFAGHELVSCHEFSRDWPTWEVHPAGDEIVILLSGRATLVLDSKGGQESQLLDTPGQFVVVPRGIWHTALVGEPTRMLFITPGEGTLNREK